MELITLMKKEGLVNYRAILTQPYRIISIKKEKTMKNRETRTLKIDDVELRAEANAEGVIVMSGYAYRFNTWSEDLGGFRERIRPGAGKKAIMISDMRALYDHSGIGLPLGRVPRTARFSEDTKGGRFEVDLPDTQLGRDLVVSINRKDLDGCSFSFTMEEAGDEWREKDGTTSRTINEFREFFDFGPVVFPAYKSTSVKVSQRSLDKITELKSVVIDGEHHKSVIAHRDEQANLHIDILTIENSEV